MHLLKLETHGLQARISWCKYHTKKSNHEFVQKCTENQCLPLGKDSWTIISNNIMEFVSSAPTLDEAERRTNQVDAILLMCGGYAHIRFYSHLWAAEFVHSSMDACAQS
jgi:hypothetical protein